ncbi:MAG: FMN-binding negative transcriptional regulator [Alcaligenaceae bacterium]|nr:MAG: FMN-binding negative transcriptional regulator [Alcaligenaceae bacterium]
MHRQKLFDVQDLSRMHGLIRDHALGTLIVQAQGRINVDHLPFVLETRSDGLGLLRTHAAKDNRFWATIPEAVDCTVVFTGPNAYISPSWYPSRRQHGRVQPSWYYSAVHAYGKLRLVHDPEALSASIRAMTDYFENDRCDAWRIDEAPRHFIEALVNHIVGLDIEITDLIGKWQVGQQRNQADRHGIVTALLCEEKTSEGKLVDHILAAATRR